MVLQAKNLGNVDKFCTSIWRKTLDSFLLKNLLLLPLSTRAIRKQLDTILFRWDDESGWLANLQNAFTLYFNC